MSTPRRLLITGASQGLNLARHYLELGDHVFGCSRGPGSLAHERYAHFSLDVTDEAAVQAMFDSESPRLLMAAGRPVVTDSDGAALPSLAKHDRATIYTPGDSNSVTRFRK